MVMYEGLSDAGTSNRTLSTEHTSVSEAMPAVPRYSCSKTGSKTLDYEL